MTYAATVRAKELLGEVISITALLTDEEALRQSCGFTVEELLAQRRLAASLLHELAEHLDRVCRDTGIARTTGGGTAILGGVLGAAGLVLAPVSGGTSMTLSLTGAGLGVGAATTTLTASIVKDACVNNASKKVKETLEALQTDDAVFCRLLQQLQANVSELIDLCCKEPAVLVEVHKWVKRTYKGAMIAYKTCKICRGVKSALFAIRILEFIEADVHVLRGIAAGTAAPGFDNSWSRRLGLTVKTGTTTAKVMSATMSFFSIAFGVWDIIEGAKDINGSQHAKAYRQCREELDKVTCEIETSIFSLRDRTRVDLVKC